MIGPLLRTPATDASPKSSKSDRKNRFPTEKDTALKPRPKFSLRCIGDHGRIVKPFSRQHSTLLKRLEHIGRRMSRCDLPLRHLMGQFRDHGFQRLFLKLGQKPVPDVLPEPVFRLFRAALVKEPVRAAPVRQRVHLLPCLTQAPVLDGRDRHRLGKVFRVLRTFADQPQRTGIIGTRALGSRFEITIGLVHQNQVGHLHDATLHPLQLVAPRRSQQKQEQVRHLGDHGFGLPHADRLDQDQIIARRFAKPHSLARAPRHTAQFGFRR